MRFFRILRNRLRALFGRDVVVDEIHEEIQFHLVARIVEHQRRGLSPDEARRAALRKFGNPSVVEDHRSRPWPSLSRPAARSPRGSRRVARRGSIQSSPFAPTEQPCAGSTVFWDGCLGGGQTGEEYVMGPIMCQIPRRDQARDREPRLTEPGRERPAFGRFPRSGPRYTLPECEGSLSGPRKKDRLPSLRIPPCACAAGCAEQNCKTNAGPGSAARSLPRSWRTRP